MFKQLEKNLNKCIVLKRTEKLIKRRKNNIKNMSKVLKFTICTLFCDFGFFESFLGYRKGEVWGDFEPP